MTFLPREFLFVVYNNQMIELFYISQVVLQVQLALVTYLNHPLFFFFKKIRLLYFCFICRFSFWCCCCCFRPSSVRSLNGINARFNRNCTLKCTSTRTRYAVRLCTHTKVCRLLILRTYGTLPL